MRLACLTKAKWFSHCYFFWWYSQKTIRYDNFILLFSVIETIRERLIIAIWDIVRILGYLCGRLLPSCAYLHGYIKQILWIRKLCFKIGDYFINVFTLGLGIRQPFSNFYLKYDYSLDRKIVSLRFDVHKK